MKSLNKREKYLVIILGAAIIAFVYLQYFLLPVLDNINKTKKDIDMYNSQLNQLNVINITNKKLKEELAKVKLSYNDALVKLPPLEKNPEIAHNIKPFADANNVIINNVSFSDGAIYNDKTNGANSSNLNSTNVNINASSNNYFDMMGFVNSLESDNRINAIVNFSINNQKISNNAQAISNTPATVISNNVSASISINYFYNLDKNAKPSYDFNKGHYGKNDIFK